MEKRKQAMVKMIEALFDGTVFHPTEPIALLAGLAYAPANPIEHPARTYEAFPKHTTEDGDSSGGDGVEPHGLPPRNRGRDSGALRTDAEPPPRPGYPVRRVPLSE